MFLKSHLYARMKISVEVVPTLPYTVQWPDQATTEDDHDRD